MGIATAVAMWWFAYLLHVPVHEVSPPETELKAAEGVEKAPRPATAEVPGPVIDGGQAESGHETVGVMKDRPFAVPGESAARFGGQPSTRVVIPVLALVMLIGGAIAGRYGLGAAVGSGLIAGLINLMIMGSVLSRAHVHEHPNAVIPTAPLWVAGYLALSALVAGIGGMWGTWRIRRLGLQPRYIGGPELSFVLAAATFLLIVIGGLVTSEEAGMAVEDWPTTQGSNMFLYPLAKMTGGVFLEHAHRLFGALVGFVTLTLFVYLLCVDRRRWVLLSGFGILAAVILQAVLGGYRVLLDEKFGTALRVFHGVFGQIFFGLVLLFSVAIWRARNRNQASGTAENPPKETEAERSLRVRHCGFMLLVVTQLVLGAITRHGLRDPFVYLHMIFAFVVIGIGGAVSMRPAFLPQFSRPTQWGARVIIVGLAAQLLLGFVAFIVTASGALTWTATLLATAHQAVGALVLGGAAWQIGWLRAQPEEAEVSSQTDSPSQLSLKT